MKRKAFTLVELLVCIAIVAILIAMLWGAIAKFNGDDKPEAVGPGKPYLVEEDDPEPPAEAQGYIDLEAYVLTRGYPVRVTVDGQHYMLLAPKGGGAPTIEVE